MPSRLLLLALATLVSACGGSTPRAAARPADPLDALSWLAGHWVADEGEARTEEQWLPPAGGTMLGVGRTVERGETVHHEWLRIEARAGAIVYVASPATQARTDFTLVPSAAPHTAIFENLEHDYPQRIVYVRDGDRLDARIEDAAGANVTRWRFTRP